MNEIIQLNYAIAWIPLVAAGLTAAANVISSAMNRKAQKDTNKFNLKANKQLSEQAFQQNKQMWQMENFYNSPQSQMARYQAAGINPNVLYGEAQAISSGNSDSVPEMSYPAYQAKAPVFDFESPMAQLLSAAQINNLNAKTKTEDQMRPLVIARTIKQTEQLDAVIDNLASVTHGLDLDNELKDKTLEANVSLRGLAVNLAQASLGEIASRENLNDKQASALDQQIEVWKHQIPVLDATANQIVREYTDLYNAMIKAYNASAAQSYSQVSVNSELKGYIAKQAGLIQKHIENFEKTLDEQIKLWKSEGKLNDKQADYLGKKVKNYFWDHYFFRIVPTLGPQGSPGDVASLGSVM